MQSPARVKVASETCSSRLRRSSMAHTACVSDIITVALTTVNVSVQVAFLDWKDAAMSGCIGHTCSILRMRSPTAWRAESTTNSARAMSSSLMLARLPMSELMLPSLRHSTTNLDLALPSQVPCPLTSALPTHKCQRQVCCCFHGGTLGKMQDNSGVCAVTQIMLPLYTLACSQVAVCWPA